MKISTILPTFFTVSPRYFWSKSNGTDAENRPSLTERFLAKIRGVIVSIWGTGWRTSEFACDSRHHGREWYL